MMLLTVAQIYNKFQSLKAEQIYVGANLSKVFQADFYNKIFVYAVSDIYRYLKEVERVQTQTKYVKHFLKHYNTFYYFNIKKILYSSISKSS